MELPYIPEGREILYVPEENTYMQKAQKIAIGFSLDQAHPTGAVVVRDGKMLGQGANGSDYHEKFGCERKKKGIPTGEKYELCPGCDPKNHAEQTAIQNAENNLTAFLTEEELTLRGADLYLWGHWWCCKGCWEAMERAGIRSVYLMEGAYEKFGGEREKKME